MKRNKTLCLLVISLLVFGMIQFSIFSDLPYAGGDLITTNKSLEPSSENGLFNINFTIESSMTGAYEFKATVVFDFRFNNSYSSIKFNLTFFEQGRTESHMEIFSHVEGTYIYYNYVTGVSGDGTGMVHGIQVTSWLTEFKFPHTSRGEPIIWRLAAYTTDNETPLLSTNDTAILPESDSYNNTSSSNSSSLTTADIISSVNSFLVCVALWTILMARKSLKTSK